MQWNINNIEKTIFSGGSKIAKGVLINEPIIRNGLLKKNGIVKGTVNLLQNGGVHLSNGFVPGNNKVAPLNGHNVTNGRDPARSMFNEVDDWKY